MAEQVTNYQCPACTGPLHFDGASGKLLCDYCGSSYSVENMEALYAEKAAQDTGTWEHAPDSACGSGRLDVQVRQDGQHGQILRRVRQPEAGGRQLDVRLRRGKQGQVLLRMRQAQTLGRQALQVQ